MTKRWIGLLPCASLVFVLVVSCGSSDSGGNGNGGVSNGGLGGSSGGTGGSNGGIGGTSGGVNAGADQGAGSGGAPVEPSSGAGGTAGASGATALAGASPEGGDGGSAGAPEDTSPLSPSAISDLAMWLDGSKTSFQDIDENYPNPPDSGRVRSVPETAPLTGSWQAPSALQRPIRDVGALNLRPVESVFGYYLRDTAGSLQTDNSTLAISFRPLNGKYGPGQGGLTAPIGASPQSLGMYFVGDSVALLFNHTQAALKRRLPRGAHVTIIVRFTSTGVDIQYDIDGFRVSESIVATISHETASNFVLGYESNTNADMYGYVSQVVGVNRAISGSEETRLMNWLTAQPIPAAFPATKPLVAILGDSIAIGDQVAGWQSWAYSMLADLATTNPDVQLLNAASGGSGVPKVKNSDYSDYVLPWYSADRAKNILIVAAGTNDLANGAVLSDIQDRYWGLLDSARATGWKVVACTLLPRSNPELLSGQAGFNSARAAFNAEIVAHWASHADALANVGAISGLGADGDSNNTAYYSDKIHPTPAGHALLESAYAAAVRSLL